MMQKILMDTNGTQHSNSKIIEIIQKYINLYIRSLESRSDDLLKLESYITTTELVPNQYFDNTTSDCCPSSEILCKNFGNPIVLFNDLKNSSKILEAAESSNSLCIYIAYMHFSSQMLAKILDLMNGKMIESTGDGNYSIFLEDKVDKGSAYNLIDEFFKDYQNHMSNDNMKTYQQGFEAHEIFSFYKWRYSFRMLFNPLDPKVFRSLFFQIFALFNHQINQVLSSPYQFFTRIGCVQGACKITRIKIDGHILQDKLIGSVVHQAAHQAGGK